MERWEEILAQVDVFYGELSGHRAYFYARLPRFDAAGEWSLAGTVRGPRCLHAQTLPAMARLVDLGPGPTHLARGTVTEPVFWSPELPAIYDVTVKLQRGGETVATVQRELGLRSLGPRGRSLTLDGKRFVIRGISTRSAKEPLARGWHEAAAVLFTEDWQAERLTEASQWGALVIVELGVVTDAVERLRMLARFPAVGMVAVDGDLPADLQKKEVAPNLLLAQVVADRWLGKAADWADVVVVDFHDLEGMGLLANRLDKPVVVRRRLPAPLAIDEARSACDRLQGELAAIGQFAGYVV